MKDTQLSCAETGEQRAAAVQVNTCKSYIHSDNSSPYVTHCEQDITYAAGLKRGKGKLTMQGLSLEGAKRDSVGPSCVSERR